MIRSKADKRFERAACIVMFAIMLIILFPFLLLFMSSITEESSLLVNGYSIFPEEISFAAYQYSPEKIPMVTKMDFPSGSTILEKMVNSEAPSILADSYSSAGIFVLR